MHDEHFVKIRQAYNDLYTSMLIKGKVPFRDTGIGTWAPTASDDVYELFKKIELNKAKNFLDLGSGDGKVVFIASLFTKAHGIEHDDWLLSTTEEMRGKLMHIPHVHKAVFVKGDFMDYDISKFDYVYWFPDKHHAKLENKFLKELNGKLILHGPFHHPEKLKKENTYDINGSLIHIFSR